MSDLGLTVAMLLAGVPGDAVVVPPGAPVVPVAPSAGDREAPAPEPPLVAADLMQASGVGNDPAAQPASPATTAEPPPPADASPVDPVAGASEPVIERSEILVTAQPRVREDPLQEINAASFEATQAVDKALVRPAAMTYRKIVPRPIRSGIRNFLTNLTEPVIFVNFLLQLKPGKAAETAGRFAINSTVGAAGLLDMAKRRPFKLPHRPNGFAYTLGYYGVKSGPFLYLPLIGPTTLRDVIGLGLDRAFVPAVAGKPFNKPVYAIASGTLTSLDQRSEFDQRLQKLQNSDRPYAATRSDYLKNRQAEIDELRGKPRASEGLEPDPVKAVPE